MTINLLPPNLKKEKEYIKIFHALVVFFVSIFLILVLATASIFLADLEISSQSNKNNDELSNQEATLKKLEPVKSKVDIINSKLDKISQIDSTRAFWSNIIKDLANDTPQKVQIKTLSLDKTTNKIDFSGLALTRRDIAAFKEKLEASKYFMNVTFYTSSLDTQTENYSFNMSCELESIK